MTLIQLFMIEDGFYADMDALHEGDPEGYMLMNFARGAREAINYCAEENGIAL